MFGFFFHTVLNVAWKRKKKAEAEEEMEVKEGGGESEEGGRRRKSSFRHIALLFENAKDKVHVCYDRVKSKSGTHLVVSAKVVLKK